MKADNALSPITGPPSNINSVIELLYANASAICFMPSVAILLLPKSRVWSVWFRLMASAK